jgi:hypothetical protein
MFINKKITFGMVFGHIFYILFRLWLAAYISVMFYGFIKVMFTELPSEAHAVMIVFLLPIPVFIYCFLMWVLVVETLRMAFKI